MAAALAFGAALSLSSSACRRRPAAERGASAPAGRVARPPALTDWSRYSFRPREKEAIEEFLRANGDLRIATDDDRRPSDGEDLHKLYGVYHPYFLRGDVNDDGLLDFVLAFVRRDSDRDSPWFSVVVFTGKDGSAFGAGTFIERDVSLADGDLSVDRDSIVITPDLDEEESARRYRWDPVKRSHVFVREESDDEERAPAAQT
jgi:hypothetical protein